MKLLLLTLFLFGFTFQFDGSKSFAEESSKNVEYEISSESESTKDAFKLEHDFIPNHYSKYVSENIKASSFYTFSSIVNTNLNRIFKNSISPNAPPFIA